MSRHQDPHNLGPLLGLIAAIVALGLIVWAALP